MSVKQINEEMQEEIKRHNLAMESLRKRYREAWDKENAKNKSTYSNRKNFLEKSGEWIQSRIKVGDWIQVTGSKAGKFREVIQIDKYGVVGNMLGGGKYRMADGSIEEFWEVDKSKVTEQGFNKITHLWVDGEFVPLKELMEKENSLLSN